MLFPLTGTYLLKIDLKHRIAIPAEIRAQLRQRMTATPDGEGTSEAEEIVYWYVALGEGDYLSLYTEASFEKRADELDHSTSDPDELLDYERLFFSLARRIEMDKAGRVRLPDALLQMTSLGRQIALVGARDHMEIHDSESWQEHVSRALEKNHLTMMNPRRAAGPRKAK